MTYISYPLILILPTILFTIGLTAFLSAVIRNHVITNAIITGLILLVFITFGRQFPLIDDFTGRNLPLLYSQFTGFGNLPVILMQRGMYVLLGLGFVLFSGVIFSRNRLRQSAGVNISAFFIAVICFVFAGNYGKHYLNMQFAGRKLRASMREAEQSIKGPSPLSLSSCRLNLVHNSDTIDVISSLTIKNISQEPVNEYNFRLNPGLDVVSVERNNQPLLFKRNLHILSVKPAILLQSGEIDSLVIKYRGTINENACYIDIDENKHQRINRKITIAFDKRYSFITPKYVLLINENGWYPSPIKPSIHKEFVSARRDFTHYQLTVETDSTLTAISQGVSKKIKPGYFTFSPEYPLTQLSLIIGDYTKLSTTVDGIEYGVYAKTGNDYSRGLEKLKIEKVHEAIRDLKRDYEYRLHLEYPFQRLYLVEVPVQFLAYYRDWDLTTDYIQPEQVLIHEKGFFTQGTNPLFYQDYSRFSKLGPLPDAELITEEEKQFDKFQRFIEWSILMLSVDRFAIGQRDRFERKIGHFSIINSSKTIASFPYEYNIYPLYFSYVQSFFSEKYPFIDLLMQYYVKSQLGYRSYGVYERIYGVADEDVIRRKLSSRFTVEELLKKPEYHYMLYYVLGAKTEALFAEIQAATGITEEEFASFIENFLYENRFNCTPAENMIEKLNANAEINFTEYFDKWQNGTNLPKFEVYNAEYYPIIFDNRDQLFYKFIVHNVGEDSGVLRAYIYDYDNPRNTIQKLIHLEKNQAKEIGVIADISNPDIYLGFVTYNSYNNRNIRRTLHKRNIRSNIDIFEGERIIDPPVQVASPDTIIVDDFGSGFRIISQPGLRFINTLFRNDKSDMIEFTGFNSRKPPPQWREGNAEMFYGKLEPTSCYIASGNGTGKVAWEADLAESGEYDVFYHTPPRQYLRRPHPFKDIYTVRDLHFFIHCDNGAEEVILDFEKSKQRWTYLGSFHFSDKTAYIELTDKSKGDTVYADAVMIIKK
ncbi:hypothetical protein ACFL50_01465 [Candidatus Latescibacterota bacterium]